MSKEIQETIEEVEKKIANFQRAQGYYAAKNEIPPTSTLKGKLFFVNILKILQVVEKAGKELGEKKEDTKFDPGCNQFMNHGYNYMHDIARPILAKAILENKKLGKHFKDATDKGIEWMDRCVIAENRIKELEKQRGYRLYKVTGLFRKRSKGGR